MEAPTTSKPPSIWRESVYRRAGRVVANLESIHAPRFLHLADSYCARNLTGDPLPEEEVDALWEETCHTAPPTQGLARVWPDGSPQGIGWCPLCLIRQVEVEPTTPERWRDRPAVRINVPDSCEYPAIHDHRLLCGCASVAGDTVDAGTSPTRIETAWRRIAAARAASESADAELRAAVEQGRAVGYSWAVIGSALSTSRQAAFQRFGDAADERDGRDPVWEKRLDD